jgi:hypothetical protein
VRRLRPIDIFQIGTSTLFLVLGGVTAVRALMYHVWFGAVVGAVMFGYGVYRWRAILRAFREARQ